MPDGNGNGTGEEILIAKNLVKHFPIDQSGVLFANAIFPAPVVENRKGVKKGECFGLVGESGSGKSTTAYVTVGTYGPTL